MAHVPVPSKQSQKVDGCGMLAVSGAGAKRPGRKTCASPLHPPSHLHPPQHREGAAEAGASRTSGHPPPASTAHLAATAWSKTHPSALCDALSHRSSPLSLISTGKGEPRHAGTPGSAASCCPAGLVPGTRVWMLHSSTETGGELSDTSGDRLRY